MRTRLRKKVNMTREHAGKIHGSGMTAQVCRFMEEAALHRRWVTPHDVIRETGCTAPTTFFSDINARLPRHLRIVKRWHSEKRQRGYYIYKLEVRGEA